MQKIRLKYSGSQWLMSKPTLYSVDSEVIARLHYAAKDNQIMVIRDRDMYVLGLHEAEEWIRRCTDPEMAEEMREVIDDIIENKRGELVYGQRMPVPRGRGEGGRTIQVHSTVLRDIERGLLQVGAV